MQGAHGPTHDCPPLFHDEVHGFRGTGHLHGGSAEALVTSRIMSVSVLQASASGPVKRLEIPAVFVEEGLVQLNDPVSQFGP